MADGLLCESAGPEILQTGPPSLAVQRAEKETGRFAVDFQNPHALPRHAVVHIVFRHLQPGPVGQKANGFHVIEIFNFADEGDHISACMTAEAIKGAVIRIDVERGRFFSVKRTKPHKISP